MIKFFNEIGVSEKLLRFLFYIFPIIMLSRSAIITIYLSLLIIFSLLFFFLKKFKIKFLFYYFLILFFFLIYILSTFIYLKKTNNLNIFNDLIFFKSFATLRFFLLYLIVKNLFHYNIIKIRIFLFVSLICCIFLSLDISSQHIFGKNIFGFPPIDERYNGIFNDEGIARNNKKKFSLFSILAIIFLRISSNYKKILLFIVSNIISIGILLSLDRMPFIIFFFSCLLLIFFLKKFRVIFFLITVFIIIIFVFLFNEYKPVNKRYLNLKNEFNINKITRNIFNISKNFDQSASNENYKNTDNYLLTGGYGQIFRSAIILYESDWLLGSGAKSFQKKCYKLSEIKLNLSCPPHPHNLYLEILINVGFIGFVIFLIFLINLTINLIKSRCSKNEIIRIISNIFLVILICELVPIRSYGSIFSTVNGSVFWVLLSIIGSISSINRTRIKKLDE